MAQDAVSNALLNGDSAAWGAFVRRYGGLVVAAVRGIAAMQGDIEDLTQEVFVRLCKDNFRLLRTYDPERAAMSTWLTIVARSTARDGLLRRRFQQLPPDRECAGRRNVGGGNRIHGEPLGNALAILGIQTPIREAGEVEMALCLGRVLGHVDRPAAPPQRRIGQARARISPGVVSSHYRTFLMSCSTTAPATISPATCRPPIPIPIRL